MRVLRCSVGYLGRLSRRELARSISSGSGLPTCVGVSGCFLKSCLGRGRTSDVLVNVSEEVSISSKCVGALSGFLELRLG